MFTLRGMLLVFVASSGVVYLVYPDMKLFGSIRRFCTLVKLISPKRVLEYYGGDSWSAWEEISCILDIKELYKASLQQS